MEYDSAGDPGKPVYCKYPTAGYSLAGYEKFLNANQLALIGRLGCDSPISLVNHLLSLFKRVNEGKKIDLITLTGDITCHGTSVASIDSPSDYVAIHYERLKLLH